MPESPKKETKCRLFITACLNCHLIQILLSFMSLVQKPMDVRVFGRCISSRLISYRSIDLNSRRSQRGTLTWDRVHFVEFVFETSSYRCFSAEGVCSSNGFHPIDLRDFWRCGCRSRLRRRIFRCLMKGSCGEWVHCTGLYHLTL